VITEPDWSHKINRYPGSKNTIEYIYSNLKPGQLIKYSSVYCYVAPYLKEKKVFLYRKLNHHLQKMMTNSNYLIGNLEYAGDRMKFNHHPRLQNVPFVGDPLYLHALLWLDRVLWLKDEEDAALLEANYFFENTSQATKSVCDFLGVEYVPVDIQFNVKKAGLNHNNEPIKISDKLLKINSMDGIISDTTNLEILMTIDRIRNYMTEGEQIEFL
jgi:hypothetical protein